MAGAVILVVLGLLPWQEAAHGVEMGTDVYLFLAGMMLLAGTARREGLSTTSPPLPLDPRRARRSAYSFSST